MHLDDCFTDSTSSYKSDMFGFHYISIHFCITEFSLSAQHLLYPAFSCNGLGYQANRIEIVNSVMTEMDLFCLG